MSVCRSKNTETEKHALIKKSISISDFFFVRECFIRLIYWFFLRKKNHQTS